MLIPMQNSKNYLIVVLTLSLFVISFNSAFAQESFAEDIYVPTSEALKEFAVSVADSAPKIIASVILLIIGLIAGKVVGKVTTKAVTSLLQKTSQKNQELHLAEEVYGKFNSVKLISATIRWFVYLFFIVAAVNALQFEQLSTALTSLWLWVPNLLAFVLIVVIGSIVVNFVSKWIEHQLLDHHIASPKIIISVIKAVIYGIVFAIAFTQLGVGESIIPILVSAFSWSIAVAIGASIAIGLGFALKDLIPASIMGASNQRSILKVGQKVKIGDITGTVTASHLLHVIVTNDRNESIVIPTKLMMNQTITIFN
ncbi:putative membrane protein [Candidatus Nitrosarchaeum limnium BG20]|uniref:Putative membrane protein n=2 Tax=Nitrosarchaeum TaxID=1007082 RepID=S2E1C3_9ARCH|nr:putative membrane protein [Candidatus Nitrosarchaeum limnium BG20]